MKRYRILVFSTSLITLTLLIMINVPIAAFPYIETYPYGIASVADDQQAANDFVLQEWEEWKSARITSSGASGYKRVQRAAASDYDSVSEGLAYGLLFSVYFDEQPLFDDLYGYVRHYLNDNGLMAWHIDAQGNVVGEGGWDCATDADEDIALALIFADKVWGSDGSYNYEQEARNFLNNLYNYCVENGTFVLKPGDTWGGSNVTNPSYFSPAWYRIFADFSGNSGWLNVADMCYEIIDNVKNYNTGTGLVPDWCTAQGVEATDMGYDFSYDAARYPWRTAIDYSWFGEERARTNCDLITDFFNDIGASGIVDGYTITGNEIGSYHNATFVSMVAAGTMTGYDQNFAGDLFAENKAVEDGGDYSYYGNCLRLLSLLYTTGNFPNLYEDSDLVDGDVDGNGSVNSVDYLLVRRFILGMIAEFPSPDGFDAADLNDDGFVNTIDYLLLQELITQ